MTLLYFYNTFDNRKLFLIFVIYSKQKQQNIVAQNILIGIPVDYTIVYNIYITI